jgi:hypothetical protein
MASIQATHHAVAGHRTVTAHKTHRPYQSPYDRLREQEEAVLRKDGSYRNDYYICIIWQDQFSEKWDKRWDDYVLWIDKEFKDEDDDSEWDDVEEDYFF